MASAPSTPPMAGSSSGNSGNENDPRREEQSNATIPALEPELVVLPVPLSFPAGAAGVSPHPSYDTLPPPSPPKGSHRKEHFMYRHRGLLYLLLAQFFASLNLVSSRYLTTSLPNGRRYHALEVLAARMGITLLCCAIWIWWKRVPQPLGPPNLRFLLVIRGFCGFVGVFSVYYAVSYLPLPDSTAISFLTPIGVSFLCHIVPVLKEPFTPPEMLCGLVSLIGVMLIARPTFLVRLLPGLRDEASSPQKHIPEVSPAQRALAVTVSLVGVLGMSAALMFIRVLGKRIHPLTSVIYFASTVTVVSVVGLLAIPSVGGVVVPQGALEWALLAGVGVFGFVMQFLMTIGIQVEKKGGTAGSMMYSQMVFAVFWEYVVWKNVPSTWSIVGGGLILASAAAVGILKERTKEVTKESSEERALLAGGSERED